MLEETIKLSQKTNIYFWNINKDNVYSISEILYNTLQKNKILVIGNGGSAADAQHFASELTGKINKDRAPLAALALTTDTSAITAIANDYGFDYVFARQIEALGKSGDVLFAISTSGNSKNIIAGVEKANSLGITTISLTGGEGGKLKDLTHYNLNVSLTNIPSIVQETHITILHRLVELVEHHIANKSNV